MMTVNRASARYEGFGKEGKGSIHTIVEGGVAWTIIAYLAEPPPEDVGTPVKNVQVP